jgi:hypothetical protein
MKEMLMDHYDLDSLSRALGMLEKRYELSSDQFFEAHRVDDPIAEAIPGFHRHLWASFYMDVQRMRGPEPIGAEFVEGVGRVLEAV